MSIKDILVHVDTSQAADVRLRVAADLARRFDAYLLGIGLAEEVGAEEKFAALLRENDLPGEWQASFGVMASYVTRRARVADLAILSQRDPAKPTELDPPEDVILGCGRPVLVLPRDQPVRRIGVNVLVAWNASREVARAIHGGLPLMAESNIVTVVSVNPDEDEDWQLGGALIRHLARHGLNATTETITTTALAPADAILERASDGGADLIVMGAYGRSRLREIILGGVTRDILATMTVPVLMAH
jgi:nucleotide-binding universal stress UspA family protein